jgi:ferredoxin-type protein NapH
MTKGKSARIRRAVMLGFMAVVAVGYFIAGGIGNFCGIGFDTITLICPLGALLVMIAERTAIPLAVLSVIAALLICVLLGKVFCSWGCAAHFLTQLPRSKRKKKRLAAATAIADADATADAEVACTTCTTCATCDTDNTSATHTATREIVSSGSSQDLVSSDTPRGSRGIKLDSRHAVLAAALLATLLFGFPVFCLACPVGLIFATVLLVMRLFAFGEVTWTLVVFPLIIAVELFLLPRWCGNFCPLGALLSLFSGLNRTFRPRINTRVCRRTTRGMSCNLCEHACPEGINLHDIKAGKTTLNDCSKCRACADICPEHAISFPLWARKDGVKAKIAKAGE